MYHIYMPMGVQYLYIILIIVPIPLPYELINTLFETLEIVFPYSSVSDVIKMKVQLFEFRIL